MGASKIFQNPQDFAFPENRGVVRSVSIGPGLKSAIVAIGFAAW
jgi:hypothetical protein